MALPAVGSPAPDFSLPSTAGGEVALSALRGKKVLIAFFPLAFTSTCTSELCAITTDYSQFVDENTVVLPISVDSIPTLKEYKAKEKLAVDLLSDFKRDVSRKYGVLNDERYFSNRSYFVVDAEGVVRWAFVEERNGDRRENAELLSRLAAV
ncbi:MAG TPA: redoxin domain-containing protein [Gemmatimonadales bacterium]|nr:redoxin domain-containing protein [Gemmatimonadales bacterium]